MKRFSIIAPLTALLVAPAWAQTARDVLYLQDGRERLGELVKTAPTEIQFRLRGDAEPTTFQRAEVQRVDLARQRAGDDAQTVEELNDPLLTRVLAAAPAKKKYPDCGYVELYSLLDYRLEADSYTVCERNILKVLQERGKDEGNVARVFFKGEETLDVDFARTIDPDGSVTPISDAALSINSVNASRPEYEKLYELKFAMQQVREGSVLDYQITRRREKTDLLHPFFVTRLLRGEEPMLEVELRINLPKPCELSLRTDRLGSNVESSREEHGDRVTHTFVAKQCQRVVREALMPPARDFCPLIMAATKADWPAIGAAFGAAVTANSACSEDMRTKVAELIAGTDDPQDRAERIYYYFIESIHQIRVPLSQYGYTPHPVADTYSRRAGNTLDKAVLLSALLQAAGLNAGVVLACPQGTGHLAEDVPCIRQLDSAFVAFDLPAGRRFLMVADEATKFGLIHGQYQGTRGLLISAAGSELIDIPMLEPVEEAETADYQMRVLPSGDVSVTKVRTPLGNYEVGARHAWKDLKDEEVRRRLEQELTGINAQAKLEDYSFDSLHDITKQLKITEKYTLLNYAMPVGSRLLVFQLPEVGYGAATVGKPTREFPLHWGQRYKTAKSMRIAVPDGFRVYYAGQNWTSDVESTSFSAEFASTEHEVTYRDEFTQKVADSPAQQYSEYRSCIETMARVAKEWIVLERVTSATSRQSISSSSPQ